MADLISNIDRNKLLYYIEKALDGSSKRQAAISNNIANVDTPNFKRSDVPFQEELKRAIGQEGIALTKTNKGHLPATEMGEPNFVTIQDTNLIFRNDGNNVDIDSEMTLMAQNNVFYNAYAQMASSKLGSMKMIIEEGGR